MRIEKIAEHFCGEKPTPLRLSLKNGSEKLTIVVDFARLVLPEIDGLQTFGRVKPFSPGRVELTPNVALEILAEDGLLCSADEEQRRKLRKWFLENFPSILRLYAHSRTRPHSRAEVAKCTSS